MVDLNDDLAAEIQKLAPTGKVYMFEIDLTAQGGDIYYFHDGTNGLTQNIVWQGITYTPWPANASGFDYSSSGQLPRPKLSLGNAAGSITAIILQTQDAVGGKVTRRGTMVKFLDAINFPGGVNATEDPTASLPDEVYFIDRKSNEDPISCDFELTAAHDVVGVKLPRRQIIQNICPWRYRGAECSYAGTDYFRADDTPTTLASQDVCGKRLSSCKLRFGENEELPYGGFPGAGLLE